MFIPMLTIKLYFVLLLLNQIIPETKIEWTCIIIQKMLKFMFIFSTFWINNCNDIKLDWNTSIDLFIVDLLHQNVTL
jgi:hypothetical protein